MGRKEGHMSIVGARDAYKRGEITYEELQEFEKDWKDEHREEDYNFRHGIEEEYDYGED